MGTGNQRLAAAEVIARAKTKTARARLQLDGDLLDRHAVLSEQMDAADDVDAKTAIAEQLVALEAEMADTEFEFRFKGRGRVRWQKVQADHPPTDEQAAKGADFDVDVFPYVIMAESLVEPVMTEAELRALCEQLDEVQFGTLWGACLKANLGSGAIRPGGSRAAAFLESVRPKSEQPSEPESLEAS